MKRTATVSLTACFALLLALSAPSAQAGTQDFTLFNQTGSTIYAIHISETTNDDWEEDILGENTLANGARLNVTFSGRSACMWDILAVDPDDNQVSFSGINLCEASIVVLKCNDSECWAEYE